MSADNNPSLTRKLGTTDAVVIGLGSMIGAGVFAVFAPAAMAAGTGLLLGLALAGLVAYCNATSSAALAARYPVSGGAYIFGRERLGPAWGWLAGWGFVVGKTASCAAMALTFASYVAPTLTKPLAVAAILALALVNYFGVTKTALLARILLTFTLIALVVVLLAIFGGGQVSGTGLATGWTVGGPYGVLQAGGLLFFAFAGYARIATMGEEVREPARTIPRAIPLALAIALLLYLLVGVALLLSLGPDTLAHSTTPLADAVSAGQMSDLAPAARVGAGLASLGALLALISGIGRTSLAMARHHDLPTWLAAVHPRYRVPHHAEFALMVLLIILVLTVDLRTVLGFSSFGVLVYYAIANAAALTLPNRRRWFSVVGLLGCVTLAATLPWPAVATGIAIFLIGLAGRTMAHRGSA